MSTPKNIYTGKRYVPKQCGDWNNGIEYESLSVVLWQGDSYTSKQDVPRGVDITNIKYWIKSANYNAQVAIYEQNVRDYHQYVIDQIGIINDSNTTFQNNLNDSNTTFQNNINEQLSEKAKYSTLYFIDNIESLVVDTVLQTKGFYDNYNWYNMYVPDGIFNYVVKEVFNGTYSALQYSHSYSEGDCIEENGIIYKCIVAGTSPSSLSTTLDYIYKTHERLQVGGVQFIKFASKNWYDTGLGFYINDLAHIKKDNNATKKLIALPNKEGMIDSLSLGVKPAGIDPSMHDSFRTLQGALNFYKGVVLPTDGSLYLGQTLMVKFSDLIGNASTFIPLPSGVFTNNVMVSVCSTDVVNSMYFDAQNVCIIENINFINYDFTGTIKGIFLGGSPTILKDLTFSKMNQEIEIASAYIDRLELHNISITNHIGSLYSIEQLESSSSVIANGDGWIFERIFGNSTLGGDNNLIHLQCQNTGVKISNVVNGNIYLENCQAEVINIHGEPSNVIIQNAKVSIENSVLTHKNGVIPLLLQTNVNGNSKAVTLKNVVFRNSYWSSNNGNTKGTFYNSIRLDDNYMSNVYLENVGFGYIQESGCAVGIQTGGGATDSIDRNKHVVCKKGIINAKKVIEPTKFYTRLPSNDVFSSIATFTKPSNVSGPTWNNATGAYYYRILLQADYTRKLGLVENISQEKYLTLTNGGDCVLIKLLASLGADIANVQMTVFRGTSTNSYTEYCDIYVTDTSAEFIDTGNSIMLGTWITQGSPTTSFNYNTYKLIEKDLEQGTVTVWGTATPTVGNWTVGDRVINTNRTIGQVKSWICSVAGTSGTWISEGTY